MPRWITTYPDVDKLESTLAEFGPVRIVDRAAAMYTSTFLSEVLTCRFPDGTERKLLSKYGDIHEGCVIGHKGGLPYEAAIYRHILEPIGLSTPRFCASGKDPESRDTWLFIEYLEGATRLNLTKQLPIEDACRWIAVFHSSTEDLNYQADSINRYTTDYYLGWARRSVEYSAPVIAEFPWLPDLCKQFEEMVEALTTGPVTIIHGEFYPANVLVHKGRIRPVDWESTAIGAGEIDLATIVHRWKPDVVARCVAAYSHERWPEGPPADFQSRLAAARIYCGLRWLGEHPNNALGESRKFLQSLFVDARQLELI